MLYITDAPADPDERQRAEDEVYAYLSGLRGVDDALRETISVQIEPHPDDPDVEVIVGRIGESPDDPEASWQQPPPVW